MLQLLGVRPFHIECDEPKKGRVYITNTQEDDELALLMAMACEHATDVVMLKEEDGDEGLLLDDTGEANTKLVPMAVTGDQDVALMGV